MPIDPWKDVPDCIHGLTNNTTNWVFVSITRSCSIKKQGEYICQWLSDTMGVNADMMHQHKEAERGPTEKFELYLGCHGKFIRVIALSMIDGIAKEHWPIARPDARSLHCMEHKPIKRDGREHTNFRDFNSAYANPFTTSIMKCARPFMIEVKVHGS
eukprot:jgi/Tetstr1/429505/TSEL_019410.t1